MRRINIPNMLAINIGVAIFFKTKVYSPNLDKNINT